MKLNRILITTDLSTESLRPFEPVAELARNVGASILLLHVVQDLLATPHGAPLAPPMSSPDLGPEMERARAEIEKQRAHFGEDVEVSTDVISAVDVPKAIVAHAVDKGADLIAISTHGRKGWRRLAVGSVAERVLRESSLPVLTFHRPE